MNKRKMGTILGALVHDIGLFMRLAALERDYPELDSYFQSFCPAPDRHCHAAYSAFFVDRWLPESLVDSEMREILLNANRPDRYSQEKDLFKVADALSSGIVQQSEENSSAKDRSSRLHSIFDSVEISFSIRGKNGTFNPLWFYPPVEIEMESTIFPLHVRKAANEECPPEPGKMADPYRRLWEGFSREVQELNALSVRSLRLYLNELFHLLHKYTCRLPGSEYGMTDVSLFDHLKATAAIAGCVYDRKQEPTEKEKEFILLGADLSGIQPFIFRITRAQGVGGISKRLRGRSFYLSMLMEVLSRYIIRTLDLTPANVNFCGGGNMELLLPHTNKSIEVLKQFESDVNRWLLKNYFGQLGLTIDWVSMSGEELKNDFGSKKMELQDRLNLKKKRKFSENLEIRDSQEKEKFTSTGPTVCPSCNLSLVDSDAGGEEVALCKDCHNHKEMGKALPKAEVIMFTAEPLPRQKYDWKAKYSFEPFGYVYLLNDIRPALSNIDGECMSIPSANGRGDDSRGPKGFYPLSNVLPTAKEEVILDTEKDRESKEEDEREGRVRAGYALSFNTLADMAEGDKRIGILKMDVDRLGLIFCQGLEAPPSPDGSQTRLNSLSGISTLSRELSYFFNGLVAAACKEITAQWYGNSTWQERAPCRNEDVSNIFYVVFSGGDDLFVIGPWDRIIDLAVELRRMFKEFTCHNPNLTISAGIFICKPKYPISLAAAKAEEALERSKSKGRNRITVFGETAVWEPEDSTKSRIFDDSVKERYGAFNKYEMSTEEIFRTGESRSTGEPVVSFSELLSLEETFRRLYDDKMMPRQFVHRLLEGKRRFFPVYYNDKEDREEESQNKMILPYLFYITERNLDPTARQEIQEELIRKGNAIPLLRQVRIPATMFLMKTRSQ